MKKEESIREDNDKTVYWILVYWIIALAFGFLVWIY